MPYAHGPSVKKHSKMATLLLARNYIILLNRSVEEMRRMLSDLYRQHMGVTTTAAHQTLFNGRTQHSRVHTPTVRVEPSASKTPHTSTPTTASTRKSPASSVDQPLLASLAPNYISTTSNVLLSNPHSIHSVHPSLPGLPPSLPGIPPSFPGIPLSLPGLPPSLTGLHPSLPCMPPLLPGLVPPGFSLPPMPESSHLIHALHHTGTDSCTCTYCHIGLKQETLFKVQQGRL